MSYNREIWLKAIKTRCSEKEGFEYFGAGGCSTVYTHPEDPDVVYKIGHIDFESYKLLRLLVRRPELREIATVYDIKIIDMNEYRFNFLQVMEKVETGYFFHSSQNISGTEIRNPDCGHYNMGKRFNSNEVVHLDLGCLLWQKMPLIAIPKEEE